MPVANGAGRAPLMVPLPVTPLPVAVVTTGTGTATASSKSGADWATDSSPLVAATIG